MRRIAYGTAGGLLVIGMVGASYEARQYWPNVFVLCAIPLSVLRSLPRREWRSAVLAGGAAVVAVATSGIPELWPTVAALVFASVSEDERDSPWIGPAGGVVGSSLSLFLADDPNVGPFLATAVGTGAALWLRSWTRNRALDQ